MFAMVTLAFSLDNTNVHRFCLLVEPISICQQETICDMLQFIANKHRGSSKIWDWVSHNTTGYYWSHPIISGEIVVELVCKGPRQSQSNCCWGKAQAFSWASGFNVVFTNINIMFAAFALAFSQEHTNGKRSFLHVKAISVCKHKTTCPLLKFIVNHKVHWSYPENTNKHRGCSKIWLWVCHNSTRYFWLHPVMSAQNCVAFVRKGPRKSQSNWFQRQAKSFS